MTKSELLAKLSEYSAYEPEMSHIDADNALLEYIGDAEITAAFDAIDKWYS